MESFFKASDGAEIFVRRFEPPQGRPVKAVVHVHHGMGEHGLRYAGLAARLGEEGFAMVVHDARGHGRTASAPGSPGLGCIAAGAEGAFARILLDFQELVVSTVKARPGVPLLLLGHSFGTFVSQTLVGGGGAAGLPLAGVALSAPPARIPAVPAVAFRGLLAVLHAMHGEHGFSGVPMKLTMGKWQSQLLAAVPEAKKGGATGWEWLNRDHEEVSKYAEDEFCGHEMSVGFWSSLLPAMRRLCDPAAHKALPTGLPMLVMVGEHDFGATNDFGVASHSSIQKEYLGAGKSSPKVVVYPGARHELLLEENREEITNDLVAFLHDCVGKPRLSKL